MNDPKYKSLKTHRMQEVQELKKHEHIHSSRKHLIKNTNTFSSTIFSDTAADFNARASVTGKRKAVDKKLNN